MVLARQAAAGNGLATGRLLRMLTPRLGSIVRAIMGAGHPDRDDALQVTLIGFVQAFVFTLLVSVYIGLICNHGDEHHDDHAEAAH